MIEAPDYWADPRDVIADVKVGSADHPWSAEFRDLWSAERRPATLKLLDAILDERQIREPILIGSDGRLWDGHHRVTIAIALGFDRIPVCDLRPNIPKPSMIPPMWANDPTRSRRPKRKKNQPTRQGIA